MPRKKKNENSSGVKFSMKNFGPIAKGEVDLKNLTIFIGPNNSGKSYAAMLIHSLFQAADTTVYPQRMNIANQGINVEAFRKFIEPLRQRHNYILPPDHEIYDAVESFFSHHYSLELFKEFRRIFLVESPKELISSFSQKSEISLSVNNNKLQMNAGPDSWELDKLELIKPELQFEFGKGTGIHFSGSHARNIRLIIPEFIYSKSDDPYRDILSYIFTELGNLAFVGFRGAHFYLPPSRSGIMQSRNQLISTIVKGREDSATSDISGIVKDFLSFFIEIQNKKPGKYWDLASSMEKELIQGEILLETHKFLSRSIINYKKGNLLIPIERASSTIQELAPLLLYLKYQATIWDYIFIEEPEAHLHPENQKKLARFLVKLIRAGLKVLITTHSDYLLEQLGTFVLMSGIDEKDRVKKYKYDKDDYLLPEEVSPYLFTKPRGAKGYKIEPIEVSMEQGISIEEYAKVAESLYNEYASVQNRIADQKRGVK